MAITFCVLPEVGCNKAGAVGILCLLLFLLSMNSGGDMPVPTEMAPAFSGTVFGICNTFSSSAGFIAPSIVGAILQEDATSLHNWTMVFYWSSGIFVLGAVLFIVFGSAELQPWAEIEKPAEKEADVKKEKF